MKRLTELTGNIRIQEIIGNPDVIIAGITMNSREVVPGMLFAAVRGTHTDGHKYIGQAIENGATAILCEKLPETVSNGTVFVLAGDTAECIGPLASAFYNYPSESLKVIRN